MKEPIAAARTAHLCIDMQRLFSAQGPWPAPWMERVLPRVADLCANLAPDTVFTRFVPPATAAEAPGRWRTYYERWPQATLRELDPALLDLMPPLARLVPPAEVVDKPVYSAFAGPLLHRRLRSRGVDTLIVSGSETDVCVLATVLGAVDLGYRVVLATDCVCSSSDAGHDALLGVYHRRFGVQIETAVSAEILDRWV